MKPTIVLLHGALGSHRQMIKVEEKFKPNYRVLSMTFVGHGGSTVTDSYSLKGFVDQLNDFINEHQLAEFSIFGYSLGGYVALKYSLTYQKNIDQIFTFGTKFNWTTESAEEEVKKMNPTLLEEKVPHFADWLKKTHSEENWKKVLYNTADFMRGLGADNELLNDDLSNIKCLVTVAVGDQDQMVNIDESRVVMDRLQNARLRVLQGAQHPIDRLSDAHLNEIIARN
jgi:pimeloyl-ACP methyl ester carboxylesterase